MVGESNFLFASVVRVHSGDLTLQMALPILALFPIIVLATWIGRRATFKIPKIWQDRVSLDIMIFAMIMILKEVLN